MRSDYQNDSVHAVATTLGFDCVSSDNRPYDKPQQSLATCDMAKLVAVMEEDVKISRYRYKILAARILCEFLPEFGFLKELIPAHLPTAYSQEMSAKSVVIPFPVLKKDEKKYSEVVDVLDQLETWVYDIHNKAGLVSHSEVATNPSSPPMPPHSLHSSSLTNHYPMSHQSQIPRIQ